MTRWLAPALLLALGPALRADPGPRFPVSSLAHKTPCDPTGGWFDPNKPRELPTLEPAPRAPPPQPKQQLRLLIRAGEKNSDVEPFAALAVAEGERFTVQLPAGTWCVVLDDKKVVALERKRAPKGWNAACVLKQRQRCDAVWKVSGPLDADRVERQELCASDEICNPKRPPPTAMD